MELTSAGAEWWVSTLGLSPHPEGGFYTETYRSPVVVDGDSLPEQYSGPRSLMTSILFLLTDKGCSRFHRLRGDELWCYQAGGTIVLHTLDADGAYRAEEIGPRPHQGQQIQVSVPGGSWLGAEVKQGEEYALLACIVAPGFEFEDFELATREELLTEYAGQREVIERLT